MWGESSKQKFQREQRYRSLLERPKSAAYRKEPLLVINEIIAGLESKDLHVPASKFLRDVAREVSMGVYHGAVSREHRPDSQTSLPEDERLNEVDDVVSEQADESIAEFATLLKNISRHVEDLEKSGRFKLGARREIQEGLISALRDLKQNDNDSTPTIDELIAHIQRQS